MFRLAAPEKRGTVWFPFFFRLIALQFDPD